MHALLSKESGRYLWAVQVRGQHDLVEVGLVHDGAEEARPRVAGRRNLGQRGRVCGKAVAPAARQRLLCSTTRYEQKTPVKSSLLDVPKEAGINIPCRGKAALAGPCQRQSAHASPFSSDKMPDMQQETKLLLSNLKCLMHRMTGGIVCNAAEKGDFQDMRECGGRHPR